jgi:hypothetical protein
MRSADAGLSISQWREPPANPSRFSRARRLKGTLKTAPKGGMARPQKASDGDSRRFAVVQHSALYHHDRRVQAN